MTTLLAIDPGMRTGLFFGQYTESTPLMRTGFLQLDGGLGGFKPWLEKQFNKGMDWDVWVCEKFVPLPMARSFKLAELEPIRIEGMLEWVSDEVIFQRSGAMVLANEPNATTARRKKLSDDVLKRAGWWLTGKRDLNMSDANDANAAAKHALAYMRSIGHEPTISAFLNVV